MEVFNIIPKFSDYKELDDYEPKINHIIDCLKKIKMPSYSKDKSPEYVLHICRVIESYPLVGNKKNAVIEIICTLNPKLSNDDLETIDLLINYFHINGYILPKTFLQNFDKIICYIFKTIW